MHIRTAIFAAYARIVLVLCESVFSWCKWRKARQADGKVRSRLARIQLWGSDYLDRAAIMGHLIGDPPVFHWWQWHPINLYLHRITAADSERDNHNHPWSWAYSLILLGGYTESVGKCPQLNGTFQQHGPGSINPLPPDKYHRITRLHSKVVWSLVITSRAKRAWGYWMQGRGHVEHETYWREMDLKSPVAN